MVFQDLNMSRQRNVCSLKPLQKEIHNMKFSDKQSNRSSEETCSIQLRFAGIVFGALVSLPVTFVAQVIAHQFFSTASYFVWIAIAFAVVCGGLGFIFPRRLFHIAKNIIEFFLCIGP